MFRPLAALLGCLVAMAAGQDRPNATSTHPQPSRRVELPEGPAGRAFASVSPTTPSVSLPGGQIWAGDFDAPAWRGPAAWEAWSSAVRAEAVASPSDDSRPARRATLARIALAQGRWDDAWDHFAATGADPAICAALLPSFLPGVEATAASTGGIPAALPEGALLRPAIPPPSVPAAQVALGRNWIERRTMRVEGLEVGAARLAMSVTLQSDGIQIDFDHQGGGATRVLVLLPEPADFQLRVEYVDWMRQDELGRALELSIAPGDETHSLFGRFRPRAMPWPTQLPPQLSRALADHGLALCFDAADADVALYRSASAALAAALDLPVRADLGLDRPFAGVRIDLSDRSLARRKLLGVLTLAERWALRGQG